MSLFGKDKGTEEKGKRGAELATSSVQNQLLADLLETKAGRFGDPEEKLRRDICKRLKVGEEEAFKTVNLMAYTKFKDIRGELEKIRANREAPSKEKVVEEKPEEAPRQTRQVVEKKEEGPIVEVKGEIPVSEMPVQPSTGQLMADLVELKKGRFGDAEKKLRKDIASKLKIPGDRALEPISLVAYSKLPGVRKELEKLRDQRKKAEAKQVKEQKKVEAKTEVVKKAEAKRIEKPGAKELIAKTVETSDVQERAQRVAEIMEEQKRLDEEQRRRKLKKKKRRNVLALPFVYIGKALSFVISKIIHVVFILFITIASIPITIGKIIARFFGGLMQGAYRRVGRFSPFGWRKKINELVIYSGITKTQEEITGLTIVDGGILAVLVAAGGYFLLNLDIYMAAIAGAATFGAAWIVVYSVLNLLADKRTDEVESTLPDVLQIISANISAGMTPYNALWVSARKEFGSLAEEIKIAQKETLGGKSFTDSLTDMANRVRSNILQRTIRLIIQGMKAGGELPNILQGIGTDIRQMRLLQKEMAANTMSYTLFILFGMILGAPLLFSVSIQFVDIMNKFQPEDIDPQAMAAATGGGGGMGGSSGINMMAMGSSCPKDFDSDGIPDKAEKAMGLNPKNESDASLVDPNSPTGQTYLQAYKENNVEEVSASCITADYLRFFGIMALLSIAFFGSILIGLIREGRQSAGMKYAPLLIPATLGMFVVMNFGLSFFFKAMFAA
ncbi:MAG: type II secretion system F family protein [Candidatus Altiarchaeota archaeon]|nr:type II secretion system F family protein [Candidatus Altiarchaeota archaeon]